MTQAKSPDPLVRPAHFKPDIKSYVRDIDTYVKPQERYIAPPSVRSNLESLAYALRGTSPILEKHFRDKEAARQQELIAEGERLQKETGKLDFAEALKEHPEYEKYSPYLQEGFEKQKAIVLGVQYNQYLTELRMTDQELAQIQDPSEASAYLQQKGSEWIKVNAADVNDRAVQQYLLTAVNESNNYQTSQTTEARLNERVQAKTDMFQTAISASVEETLLHDGSPDELAGQVSAHIDNTILDGMNPSKANNAAVDALISLMQRKAKEGDMKSATGVKTVLENLKGHAGASLSKIIRYRTAIDTAWEKVGDEAYQQIARDRQLKAWEKEDAIQEVRDKHAAEIWASPTKDYTGLLANVSKEYGPDAAKELAGDIGTALSYQQRHKTYLKSLTSGSTVAAGHKQIKESLIALSYARPLTDSECGILAEVGGTAQQVMNAKYGRNVKDDGLSKKANDIAMKVINKKEADYGVADYELRQSIRGEILADLSEYREGYHTEHGRLPSKFEQDDYLEDWLIRRKKGQSEAAKDKAFEKEKEDKITKAVDKNNHSSIFKSLPKVNKEILQSLINEERTKKQMKGVQ